MRMSIYICLCLALVAGCSKPMGIVQFAETPDPLVVQNVTVFAGDATATTPGLDVWIEAGRIARIVPTGEPIPEGIAIVDGRGKTLLPGLIDVHTHTTGTGSAPWKMGLPNPIANLEKYLYAGITTVFDLGGSTSQVAALQAKLRAGELVGPDLYFSGPHIGPADGHPAAVVSLIVPWPFDWLMRRQMSFEVETVADVAAAIAALKKANANLAKITIDELPLNVPKLPPDLVRTAVRAAHDAGYMAVAHIGTVADALLAVESGVDALVHGVYRETLTVTDAAKIAAAGVPMAPTVGVFHASAHLFHDAPEPWTPLETQLISPEIRHALASRPDDYKTDADMDAWSALNWAHRDTRFANVAAMREAGVTLLVGSDSVISGWEAGASLHREMAHLVRGGYTPAEVLRAATFNNARAFKLADRGTIAPGQTADLLLVDGDPTEDIARVSEIVMVFRDGKKIRRTPPRY